MPSRRDILGRTPSVFTDRRSVLAALCAGIGPLTGCQADGGPNPELPRTSVSLDIPDPRTGFPAELVPGGGGPSSGVSVELVNSSETELTLRTPDRPVLVPEPLVERGRNVIMLLPAPVQRYDEGDDPGVRYRNSTDFREGRRVSEYCVRSERGPNVAGLPSSESGWATLSPGEVLSRQFLVAFGSEQDPCPVNGEIDTTLRLEHRDSGEVYDIQLESGVQIVRSDDRYW